MRPLTWMRAIRDSDLPRHLRNTGVWVGLRADRNGQCWPAYDQIAEDVGASRRTVIRNVAALRERGWLMVVNRANGHGSQSNSYLLITPGGGVTHVTPGVSPMTPGGVTHVTPQGVSPMSPRSSRPNEVRNSPALAPVDNPHLAAVIALMDRQHALP